MIKLNISTVTYLYSYNKTAILRDGLLRNVSHIIAWRTQLQLNKNVRIVYLTAVLCYTHNLLNFDSAADVPCVRNDPQSHYSPLIVSLCLHSINVTIGHITLLSVT